MKRCADELCQRPAQHAGAGAHLRPAGHGRADHLYHSGLSRSFRGRHLPPGRRHLHHGHCRRPQPASGASGRHRRRGGRRTVYGADPRQAQGARPLFRHHRLHGAVFHQFENFRRQVPGHHRPQGRDAVSEQPRGGLLFRPRGRFQHARHHLPRRAGGKDTARPVFEDPRGLPFARRGRQ